MEKNYVGYASGLIFDYDPLILYFVGIALVLLSFIVSTVLQLSKDSIKIGKINFRNPLIVIFSIVALLIVFYIFKVVV